jgi:hypothetical protein
VSRSLLGFAYLVALCCACILAMLAICLKIVAPVLALHEPCGAVAFVLFGVLLVIGMLDGGES